MKWYKKYLDLYDQPVDRIPTKVLEHLKKEIQNKNSQKPKISVVGIAHNEEQHLVSCIWSIIDNICDEPYELIIVNNNSTDGTEEVLKNLGVTYYNEPIKGPGAARQCGLMHSNGDYCICIDTDSVYPNYYIATHVKHLKKKKNVATFSKWKFIPDAKYSRGEIACYELIRNIYLQIQNITRPELSVRGMCFAFKSKYGKMVNFDPKIMRGEDGAMAIGLKKYGHLKYVSSNKATVLTNCNTLKAKGSIYKNLMIRFVKFFKQIPLLFCPNKK